MELTRQLAEEFHLKEWQAEAVVALFDEGATIPFIARYRKEAHGSLDDQVIHDLTERLSYLRNLEKRRQEVTEAITQQEKMTDAIADALTKAVTLAEIEDIYRPFRPKRRTRATVAKEKGLEPLAEKLMLQLPNIDPQEEAAHFIDAEKGITTVAEALAGAKDIIAEVISDHADIRRRIRNLFTVAGIITVKAVDPEQDSVYTNYYEYEESVKKIADHRILAIDRGEKENFLKVSLSIEPAKAQNVIRSVMLTGDNACSQLIYDAGLDAYDRLIAPSVQREVRSLLTERADTGAIKVFGDNLRQLLMQPPVKNKVTLGLDPGYRTGCKAAVVDGTGRVLDTGVLYLTHSDAQKQAAAKAIKHFITKYNVDIISIGNGTASKETEIFVSDLLKTIDRKIAYMVVSEAGASVYSASKLAAEEFPQFDLTLRSAVSIARRLQDPLAELVKIEPKAIGVGQYQHDMPKKQLEQALDFVVEECVNNVGVDLNTASAPLLARVSGINGTIAKNIVAYREENGRFSSRAALKKVPKLGPKAFEQCAGFLRVADGKNVLDATAVHPESYSAAKALLEQTGYQLEDVRAGKLDKLPGLVAQKGPQQLADLLGVGLPTLHDIISELQKPGRDPRDELPAPMLRTDVLEMKDLKPGMELKGTVRNVIDFGAFVDIGVHQDGLVHISQITNRFIKHPSEVVKVGDIVPVWVLSVEEKKGRIALTMKQPKGE